MTETTTNVTPLPPPKKRAVRTVRADAVDLEATAIHRCSVALKPLSGDQEACKRVLDYVTRRFVPTPTA